MLTRFLCLGSSLLGWSFDSTLQHDRPKLGLRRYIWDESRPEYPAQTDASADSGFTYHGIPLPDTEPLRGTRRCTVAPRPIPVQTRIWRLISLPMSTQYPCSTGAVDNTFGDISDTSDALGLNAYGSGWADFTVEGTLNVQVVIDAPFDLDLTPECWAGALGMDLFGANGEIGRDVP